MSSGDVQEILALFVALGALLYAARRAVGWPKARSAPAGGEVKLGPRLRRGLQKRGH